MLSPQCDELSLCDVEGSLDKSVKLDNKHVSQPHKATVRWRKKDIHGICISKGQMVQIILVLPYCLICFCSHVATF